MIHLESKARTVVPVHPGRTIKEPLLRAIVRDANLTVEEFIELL
jgi:predicted RNA binding protein YcfA (HicA-like mRNA interferase family)